MLVAFVLVFFPFSNFSTLLLYYFSSISNFLSFCIFLALLFYTNSNVLILVVIPLWHFCILFEV